LLEFLLQSRFIDFFPDQIKRSVQLTVVTSFDPDAVLPLPFFPIDVFQRKNLC